MVWPNKKIRIPFTLITIFLLIIFSKNIYHRFDDILNPVDYGSDFGSNSLEFRIKMTVILLTKAFIKHPIFGFGLGSSKFVIERYGRSKWIKYLETGDDGSRGGDGPGIFYSYNESKKYKKNGKLKDKYIIEEAKQTIKCQESEIPFLQKEIDNYKSGIK